MFGLSKTLTLFIVYLAVGALGIIVVTCYGRGQYKKGRENANTAHTDSVRRVLTKSLDSAEKVMVPVLETLRKENAELRAKAEMSRQAALAAAERARRAESALRDVPDSVMAVTPPEVRSLIDSLVVSTQTLRGEVERLAASQLSTQAKNDSLLAAATDWEAQYRAARQALAAANTEIAQLQKAKKPPRAGFKSGLLVGTLALAGAVFLAGSLTKR